MIEAQEAFDNDSLYQMLVGYVEKKAVRTVTRVAGSYRCFGKQMTPAGATEIMEILGKEESIARIKKELNC